MVCDKKATTPNNSVHSVKTAIKIATSTAGARRRGSAIAFVLHNASLYCAPNIYVRSQSREQESRDHVISF